MLRSLTVAAVATGFLGLGVLAQTRSAPTAKATVLLFLSTDCPVSAKYTSRLNNLYSEFSPKGVRFEALFPNDLETRPSVEAYMAERQYQFPFQIDIGAQRAKQLSVSIVPTAVVLDGNGKAVYEGAIDDNPDATSATHPYLKEALDAELRGSIPAITRAPGKGCVLMPSSVPPSAGAVNFADHVRPILDAHCTSCHRAGEVAPFSLIGYANAKKWAPMIANVTASRQMPPWKAVHGYGDFRFENTLSESEIETLRRWSEAGAPKGDLVSDETAPPPPNSEWPLGKPDLVLTLPKPYKLDADGPDVYRNFVFKANNTEPLYISAMDLKPGNRKIVHHAIVFVDRTGYSSKLEARTSDGQPGYVSSGAGPGFFPDTSFGGWVPGALPRPLPSDTAFMLKPGANMVLQVHYHKDGKPEEDQTRVALYFAKAKPAHVMTISWLVNPMIDIPAGDARHFEHIKFHVTKDMTIYAVMPHMHLLGRSMKAHIVYPDGTTAPLIFVNDWDFNWQISYILKEPLKVPKGSEIIAEATYDNSASNTRNPNKPPKEVSWGEQTSDEMFVLVLANTFDSG